MNSVPFGSWMRRRHAVIALAVLGVAVLSFGVGASLAQRSMLRSFKIQLDGVQARLLVDRIVEERKVKSLLARGCVTEAVGEITNRENTELRTLAGFVDGNVDSGTLKYITHQDPDMLDELKTLNGTFVNTWSAVGCEKLHVTRRGRSRVDSRSDRSVTIRSLLPRGGRPNLAIISIEAAPSDRSRMESGGVCEAAALRTKRKFWRRE